jgi:putative addiction module killer protein
MLVKEYVRPDGSNPYKKWFDSLDRLAAEKVSQARLRLESGNTSAVKWFGGIGEYRIHWGPGYRVYLLKDGDVFIVLLGGGIKQTQRHDIQIAKKLYVEYKRLKSWGG